MSTAYPLPLGHYFGYPTGDLRSHSGIGSPVDQYHLVMWQRRYKLTIDRDAPITGHFDGPTQRACARVQHAHGLDVTGKLDGPTWAALMEASETPLRATQSDETPEVVVQAPDTPTEPTEAPKRRRGRPRAKVREGV